MKLACSVLESTGLEVIEELDEHRLDDPGVDLGAVLPERVVPGELGVLGPGAVHAGATDPGTAGTGRQHLRQRRVITGEDGLDPRDRLADGRRRVEDEAHQDVGRGADRQEVVHQVLGVVPDVLGEGVDELLVGDVGLGQLGRHVAILRVVEVVDAEADVLGAAQLAVLDAAQRPQRDRLAVSALERHDAAGDEVHRSTDQGDVRIGDVSEPGPAPLQPGSLGVAVTEGTQVHVGSGE